MTEFSVQNGKSPINLQNDELKHVKLMKTTFIFLPWYRHFLMWKIVD